MTLPPRLSVLLDGTVITNVVDIAVDGDTLVGTEPIFGGASEIRTKFTGDGVKIVLVPTQEFRAGSFRWRRSRCGRPRRAR